ncbi:hypothetical protein CDAR_497211 [Caerostris darwini]|uniref:Uncharacterized protein n=1 Tax=Caerostris darwini TaxID=1538125 RepID=A0AAV4S6A4_9ARAC|nr:hypothetical protein CDAR_497211 [Caerostris darwini]
MSPQRDLWLVKNVADGGEGHSDARGEVRLQSSFSFFQRKINASAFAHKPRPVIRALSNLFNLSSGEGKECRIWSFICKQERCKANSSLNLQHNERKLNKTLDSKKASRKSKESQQNATADNAVWLVDRPRPRTTPLPSLRANGRLLLVIRLQPVLPESSGLERRNDRSPSISRRKTWRGWEGWRSRGEGTNESFPEVKYEEIKFRAGRLTTLECISSLPEARDVNPAPNPQPGGSGPVYMHLKQGH